MSVAHRQKPRTRLPARLVVLGCLSLAMLIWVKLRVVTGVPRTAYADPQAAAPAFPKAEAPEQAIPKKVGSAQPSELD